MEHLEAKEPDLFKELEEECAYWTPNDWMNANVALCQLDFQIGKCLLTISPQLYGDNVIILPQVVKRASKCNFKSKYHHFYTHFFLKFVKKAIGWSNLFI